MFCCYARLSQNGKDTFPFQPHRIDSRKMSLSGKPYMYTNSWSIFIAGNKGKKKKKTTKLKETKS